MSKAVSMLRRSTILPILLLAATGVFAQTASLSGRILDPSGSLIPGAKVTLRALDTNIDTSAESNDAGLYVLPGLRPGVYEVTAAKLGFQTLKQSGLQLEVQQVAKLDLTLQVGQVIDTVTVDAQSVVLESESATLGQVIQSKQVTELPLLGRNTYALAALVPGVRASVGVNNIVVDQISTVSYAINGQRPNANDFLLDGAPNSAASQNQPVINMNPDAVQEFKVETNGFSAEFGRASGGVFNVISKSGSNNYHFSLYEFLRNDKLNANDFFANQAGQKPPPFKYNQFGGTLGGPVTIPKIYDGHNKTFFFVSVESVRFVQGITFLGSMPRPQELAGDFNNTRVASGAVVTIYDPLTTRANPNGPGSIRTPFPGNVIPANRINPVSQKASAFFPVPNTPGNPITGVNNYARTDGSHISKDTVSYRVDHYFTQNNRFFARYSADDSPWIRASAYGNNPASPVAGPQTFGRRNAVVEDSQVFSPTLLMTGRISITRLSNFRPSFSEPFDITTLGFPAAFAAQLVPRAFPFFNISGYSVSASIPNVISGGTLGATDVIRLGNTAWAGQYNATKSLARHTLKTGFEYRVIQFNNLQTGANTPGFVFDKAFTQGPDPTAATAAGGAALASFLLGNPASGSVLPSPGVANQTKYYGAFLQDTYRINSQLTLNVGLRWEMESPRTDRFNQLTNFDYAATPPLTNTGLNLHGALTFVGVNGIPRNNTKYDTNNYAPRFGLAWQLNPKTVIRGGGGLFYSSITGIGSGPSAFGISGFQNQTNMVSAAPDGLTPLNTLTNPFPTGILQPTGSSQGSATLLGQAITFTDRGNVSPYSEQWNVNIQRQLPFTTLFEVGYMGSHGLKMPQNLSLNQLPDAALALGAALRTQVANPFYGQITSGAFAGRTIAAAQLLRPYPQFDTVTSANASWASSVYHSLTVKAEKRYGKGLTVMAAYTYSKIMDYGINSFGGENVNGGSFQNFQNLRQERSVSALDQTNRFVFNTVYEIPLFRKTHGLANKVLAGWEMGVIANAYDGVPLGMTSAVNNTFSQGGGQRPNWTGVSAALPSPTVQKWFDTSQFTAPPAYTFGNAARTFTGLRAAPARQVDLSAIKNTRISERLNLQFRAEFFNLTNTPRFSPPNTVQGSAVFGVVSTMENQPRIIQFALKLLF